MFKLSSSRVVSISCGRDRGRMGSGLRPDKSVNILTVVVQHLLPHHLPSASVHTCIPAASANF